MTRITIPLIASLLFLCLSCGKDNITEGTSSAQDTDTGYDSSDFTTNVTIQFSSSGNAIVTGTSDSIKATINGNGVTIVNLSQSNIQYTVSGTTSNGYLKIYSSKKQSLILDGASITNPDGAAINIQGGLVDGELTTSGKTAYVVVSGSNRLADGSTYSATPSNEDEKAALFCEGKLLLSGNGDLTVTAIGKAGIASDDYIGISDNVKISITSTAGHGLRSNDSVVLAGGTLDITVSANGKKGISTDGPCTVRGGTTTVTTTGSTVVESGDTSKVACLKCDGDFTITGGSLTLSASGTGAKGLSADGMGLFHGGTVTVSATGSNYGSSSGGGHGGHGGGWGSSNSVASKGIKCEGNITITDGSTVMVTSATHEGIETKGTLSISGGHVYSHSTGDDAINSAGVMTISGGHVCGWSDNNDGLDANDNLTISGGVVYAICTCGDPEVAIDALEQRTLTISGGILIAIGKLERGASLTQTCYQASSVSSNSWYTMTVGGTSYAFKTPSGGSPLVLSGPSQPTLLKGASYSGGSEYFGGILLEGVSVSDGTGTSVTTSTYNSNR